MIHRNTNEGQAFPGAGKDFQQWEDLLGLQQFDDLANLPPPDASFTNALLMYGTGTTAPRDDGVSVTRSGDGPTDFSSTWPTGNWTDDELNAATPVSHSPYLSDPLSSYAQPSPASEQPVPSPGACSLASSVCSRQVAESGATPVTSTPATPAPDLDSVPTPSGGGKRRGPKPHATNRAAVAAKANRERHKAYTRQLEDDLALAVQRADKFEARLAPLSERESVLSREVAYWKSVVRNDTQIGRILKSLPDVKSVRLVCPESGVPAPRTTASSPIAATKSKSGVATITHSKPATSKSGKKASAVASAVKAEPDDGGSGSGGNGSGDSDGGGGGICVHVNNGDVSIRFCSSCSLA